MAKSSTPERMSLLSVTLCLIAVWLGYVAAAMLNQVKGV